MLRFFRLISGEVGDVSREGSLVIRQRFVAYRSPRHAEEGRINHLSVHLASEGDEEKKKPTLVLLHGYGSASGFWVANLGPLCKHFDVHAIDLPLFGRSSRHALASLDDDGPEEGIDYMLDAIHQWKSAAFPDNRKVFLAGHSFGGYLSGNYALRHPEHVEHLILLDPWGVSPAPQKTPEELAAESWGWKTARYLSTRVNPLGLLRSLPESFAKSVLARVRSDLVEKFRHLFDEESAQIVSDYIYHINAQKPATGEDLFRSLCVPIAWAKQPLADRLGELSTNIDLTVLFGDRTWISGSDELYAFIKERNVSLPMRKSRFHLVPDASHHIYIDNYIEFNRLVADTRYD